MYKKFLGFFVPIIILSLISCQSRPLSYKKQLYLAKQYTNDGLLNQALKVYNKILKKSPKHYLSLRKKGVILIKLGHYKKGISTLKKSQRRYPNNFKINFYLAKAYENLYNYPKSIMYYQLALDINKNHHESLQRLSWNYYLIRYYKQSLVTAQKALKVLPHDPKTKILLSRILLKLKKHQKVKKILTNLKHKHNSPQLAPYINSLQADLFFAKKKLKKSERLYKKALQKQPLMASAHIGLGKILFQTKSYHKAATHLEQALRIRPHDNEIFYYLGKTFEFINHKKSIFYYQKFYSESKSDPEYLSLLPLIKKKIKSLKKQTHQRSFISSF